MAPPELIRDKDAMRAWCRAARAAGRTVGCVPTMGYLHEGHLSLVRAARAAGADAVVVRTGALARRIQRCGVLRLLVLALIGTRRVRAAQVSIYVNPTQFGVGEDLDTYPRDPEGDHAKLAAAGVDAVFEPATLYESTPGAAPHETFVTVEKLQARRGAAWQRAQPCCACACACALTVCELLRLAPLRSWGCAAAAGRRTSAAWPPSCANSSTSCSPTSQCVQNTPAASILIAATPHVAFPRRQQVFGCKDYQQLALIRRLVRDLDIGVKVIGAPLLREADGLAMSSRNVRLSPEARAAALSICAALRAAGDAFAAGGRDAGKLREGVQAAVAAAGGDVDYVEVRRAAHRMAAGALSCCLLQALTR